MEGGRREIPEKKSRKYLNNQPAASEGINHVFNPISSSLLSFFWWDWDLNSGLHSCKAHLQSILLWLFLEMGS
jgi:hypothetical protein